MKRTTALTAALAAVLLLTTACSQSKPAPAPTTPPPVTEPAPAPKPDGTILSADTTGITHQTYSAGTTVTPRDGYFTLDPKTGQVDAWTLSTPFDPEARYSSYFAPTDDGRYIVARTKETGYLIDRTSKAVYSYKRSQYELVAAGDGALVFEARKPTSPSNQLFIPNWGPVSATSGTGNFAVLGADLKVRTTFKLDNTSAAVQQHPALLSPDGKKLAISAGQLYLVDLTTGKMTTHKSDSGIGFIEADPGGKSFRLRPGYATDAPPFRYTWDGESLPYVTGSISPKGDLATVKRWVGDFSPTLEILNAATGEAKFRVLGADTCYGHGITGNLWKADGSAALFSGRDGFYLVSAGGELRKLTAFQGSQSGGWHEPFPSPADPSLYADRISFNDGTKRLNVADESGKVHQSVTFANAKGILGVAGPLWHPTGAFVQLNLYLKGPGGAPCGDFSIPLTPAVQKAPFPESVTLQVTGTGDCLNVRIQPTTSAAVVTCLKDGAKVTVPFNPQGSQLWGDNHQWARVSTADGKTGWASLTVGNLTWSK